MYWSGRQPGQDSWIQVRHFSELFLPGRSCFKLGDKLQGQIAHLCILPPKLLPRSILSLNSQSTRGYADSELC